MLDLSVFTWDADRGVFNPADAQILADEAETLGLHDCAFSLERVYTGCADCKDIHYMANAIERHYDRQELGIED